MHIQTCGKTYINKPHIALSLYPPSWAHSRLWKGSTLWNPSAATKESTMRKNTWNLTLCTGRALPRRRGRGRSRPVTPQVLRAVVNGVLKGGTHVVWHTHTHIDTRTCTNKHMHTRRHTHTNTHINTHTDTHQVETLTNTCRHTHILTQTHTHTHTQPHIHARTHRNRHNVQKHTQPHICMQPHIYTHTNAYTPKRDTTVYTHAQPMKQWKRSHTFTATHMFYDCTWFDRYLTIFDLSHSLVIQAAIQTSLFSYPVTQDLLDCAQPTSHAILCTCVLLAVHGNLVLNAARHYLASSSEFPQT